MKNPISPHFVGNKDKTSSVGLKAYPCNNTLMRVWIASTSGFNRCEIARNGSHEICVTMSQSMNKTRKCC